MYFEFKHIILDYLELSRKYYKFEWVVPLLIVVTSNLFFHSYLVDNLYYLIKDTIEVLCSLLGLTLASLVLFVTKDKDERLINTNYKEGKVRGKYPTLYFVMLVSFSYLIVVEAVLCIAYFIGLLFPISHCKNFCLVLNSIYYLLVLHIFFATIRIMTNLYFIFIPSGGNN